MSSLQSINAAIPLERAPRTGAKHLYFSMLGEHGAQPGEIDEVTRSASASFLRACLEEVERTDSDVPSDPKALPGWLEQQHDDTAAAYRDYLDARRAGAPRRFFPGRSHALAFLRAVAPTKLVDGAWLYGLLRRRADARLAPLIRIYLEELGDGVATRNHVVMYRALLSQNGCDEWQKQLDDGHYTQGAIQLALAHHADAHLPEVVGFNLGYEQLPLHLPICAYELNELDIDPRYFALHVTIDNAASGHARKSLQAALDCLPAIADRDAFYRRMVAGYKLNDLGVGSSSVIASFDLERELVAVLNDKARVGAQLHADYCRVAGRSITDWLSSPSQMSDFLSALVASGWIRRGAPPEESRFWRVLHDDHGPMFGVFDAYESQLLRDWIVDAPAEPRSSTPRNPGRFRPRDGVAPNDPFAPPWHDGVRAIVDRHLAEGSVVERDDEDVQALVERLSGIDDRGNALDALGGLLSPARHASTAGLLATRIYSTLLGR